MHFIGSSDEKESNGEGKSGKGKEKEVVK